MIIKEISTQSIDLELYPETNGRPWAIVDTSKMGNYADKYIDSLKTNKAFGLVDFVILEG